jgi:methylmalonyl-CoA mutase cobalamin-binding domain/chain
VSAVQAAWTMATLFDMSLCVLLLLVLLSLLLVVLVLLCQDYDALRSAGVAAIFGPGTPIPAAAMSVLDVIEKNRTH